MVQILSMMGGGIGIAFSNGWKLSLVVLCMTLHTLLHCCIAHCSLTLVTISLSLYGIVLSCIANALIIGTFPAVAMAGLLQFKFMAGFSAAGRKSQEDAGQIAAESISHIRTVASFTGEQALLDKFFYVLQRNKSAGLRVYHNMTSH